MIESARISGIAWTWPSGAIEIGHLEKIRLLTAPDAVVTITSDWKEVIRVPLAQVPFFGVEHDYLKIDPAIPLRTTRADGPAWAKILYSIIVHKEGHWRRSFDDHEA